jgi:nucleotide-binding universal stress UspA family protein
MLPSSHLARAIDVAPAPTAVKPIESIAVATDGMPDSDNAVLLARRYAERHGARLRAVSVCEPVPIAYDWPPFAPVYPVFDPKMEESTRLAGVHAQVLRLCGPAARVPVTVRVGIVGSEVAAFAQSIDADLVIAGRGRHGMLDRLLGEEHLVRLLRTANCPVLAAEPTLVEPPRRVVIGIDFTQGSLDVARAARAIMADDGAMYLVHVKPDPPFGIPHPGQWLRSYDDGIRAGLELIRTQLSLPHGVVVEPIALNGHPGVALAEFAERSRADLIAVGVQGAGFFNRLVIGSVTTHLLRAAPCSMLAVPSKHERVPRSA